MPKTVLTHAPSRRRSSCPVSCSLDLFGDRWTLLIVRDLIFGRSRFKEFIQSPEGIPTNVLSDRLQRLLNAKVIRQVTPVDGSKHLAYELTEKGLALRPLLKTMKAWALKWEKGTQDRLTPRPNALPLKVLSISAPSKL